MDDGREVGNGKDDVSRGSWVWWFSRAEHCRSQCLQARGCLASGETWAKLALRLSCLHRRIAAGSCQLGGEAGGADLAEEGKEKLTLRPLPPPLPSAGLLVGP